ncbi:MAG: hypothetical protein HQL38_05310 [Alphaproteobacteria bacterium]|nr:hypothetical protein [Alphaproteobacteria bacterium]MBF0392079.1 hypothetical protein [Alphaproteobacteria bacterium]
MGKNTSLDVESFKAMSAQASALLDQSRRMRELARRATQKIDGIAEKLSAIDLTKLMTDMRRFAQLARGATA